MHNGGRIIHIRSCNATRLPSLADPFTYALDLLTRLGGEAPRVFKKTGCTRPKDKTGNVSDVSHAAPLDCCNRPDVNELDEKPEPN